MVDCDVMGGGMMWGMGLIWLLLVLAAAALVKNLFGAKNDPDLRS